MIERKWLCNFCKVDYSNRKPELVPFRFKAYGSSEIERTASVIESENHICKGCITSIVALANQVPNQPT